MTTIRTQLPIATDPWDRARSLFLEMLDPKEKALFEKADLDSIYHDASVSHRKYQQSSRLQAARRRLSPLVDAIDGYGKGLDVMSNTPVAAALLCPIWGSIRIALHAAQETQTYFEKLSEMLEKIGRTLPLFRDYQHLFPNHERLLQVLSEAYLNVIRFCTDVTALFKEAKKRPVSVVSFTVSCKALWKPFTLRFAEYLKNFIDLKQQVQDEANVAHMVEAKREREKQDRSRALTEARLREEKLRQTLQNFSPIDYHQKHRHLRSECHQGTTKWIFDHDSYKSWNDSTESSSLHCNGIPGSGKTILASSIIDSLVADPVDPSHLICFYYCDYADHQTLNPAVMLGTFIRQILEGSLHTEELREWVLNEWANRTSKPVAQELLPAVLNAFESYQRVTIVIDALDELSQQDQHASGSIISAFLSLRACPVRVFLSCRFEATILNKVPRPQFSIALSQKLLSKDIRRFVEDMVQDKIDKKDLTIQDPALKQEINDKLQEGAQEMFLWIKFQIEELCEAMSDVELRETLESLPRDLAGTYRRILWKISASTHGKEKAKLAKGAFFWIFCAKRPLTIEELVEAVVLKKDDKSFPAKRIPSDGGKRLRLACGNLVVFDDEHGTVRFAHNTVQQFLMVPLNPDRFARDDLVNSFRFTFDEAELHTYTLCLTYLSFSDFETQITRCDNTNNNNPNISETGGFVPSLINYMLPDLGTFGRLTNLLNGRPHPTDNLNKWSMYIQGNARHDDHEVELKRKYVLLGYASSWWCFHIPSEAHKVPVELEARTRMLVFEINFTFPHRPWNNEISGGDSQSLSHQHIPMLSWVARTGKLSLWIIATHRLGGEGLRDDFHHAMQYDNEKRDLLADIMHGGSEQMLEFYLKVVEAHPIRRAIPAWIICRALRLSPKSSHAALFAKLKAKDFYITRGRLTEKRNFWQKESTATSWLNNEWPVDYTSGFHAGAGTFLLEEAVKQDNIELVRCILENSIGRVVYFGPRYMSADQSPLARAAYENNTTMVEVLLSYMNGNSPVVRATIEDFDSEVLYQGLRKRDLLSMIDHVQALSPSSTGYSGMRPSTLKKFMPNPKASRSG